LVNTPFIGALDARSDLIDEYGKGPAKKNPRKARRNGALGTAAVALVSFAGGMYAQKANLLGGGLRKIKAAAPAKASDAKWRIEDVDGQKESLRRMNGRLYIVFKSKFGGYIAEVLTADDMMTDRRMVPSDPSPSNDSAFRTQAEAKAAAERDAGLAPKAKAAKRKR
jgi:hypothetical protein